MRKIVLASSSPRRREILEKAGISFVVDPPNIPEDMTNKADPRELVKRLALEKALAVVARHLDAIVIGADTIVAVGNSRWSKPENAHQASIMLHALSGKKHDVWTGFCIVDTKSGKRVLRAVKTRVEIRSLSKGEIERYIATGEPFDGAGGYKMQEKGGALIAKIDGDPNNVIGLPLVSVLRELEKFGVGL